MDDQPGCPPLPARYGSYASAARMIKAVFFDVDFTLIYPGPTLQGEGYQRFCARYGIAADADRFDAAVTAAGRLLDDFVRNTFMKYPRRPTRDDGIEPIDAIVVAGNELVRRGAAAADAGAPAGCLR